MISAKQSVDLAAAIYDPIDTSKFDHIVKVAGITCGIKTIGKTKVFSFAGSENLIDFVRDAFVVPEYHQHLGTVAKGFLIGVDAIYESLLSYFHTAKYIAITGHSLGCSHGIIIAGMCIDAGIKIQSLDLFAPPKTSDYYLLSIITKQIPCVRAFRNGIDPVPEIPLGSIWGQYPLIHLNESPDEPWQLDPVQWHKIWLYARGVEKLYD